MIVKEESKLVVASKTNSKKFPEFPEDIFSFPEEIPEKDKKDRDRIESHKQKKKANYNKRRMRSQVEREESSLRRRRTFSGSFFEGDVSLLGMKGGKSEKLELQYRTIKTVRIPDSKLKAFLKELGYDEVECKFIF